MRILFVTHQVTKNDGQGRVNYEIALAALEAGHEVTLLASQIAPELANHPRARSVTIGVSRLPTRLLQYQLFAWRTGAWIRAHRREFDVVHVNGFISWARADVNAVHFVHDGWYRCGFYPFRFFGGAYQAYQVLYTRLNAWCEKWAFRHAEVIVPVSQKVGDEVRALGIDAGRLEVIHNGVDTTEFAPGESQRERFGLPQAPFMLLFAGDLRMSRKNLDTVLRALVATPEHVHLVVAGILRNSPYPALAASLGVAGRVHFVDLVKDMPALMRSVDAFVFPSRYEPMGLVLLEALAAALPVVTVRTAGGAEVISADSGIVLDHPEDEVALAAAIMRIAEDREHARQMGLAAREQATRLGWQAMAARYLSLYERLAARRAPAASTVAHAAISVES
ncbi:glycosyltransferase family 4 protein [Paraburkholderia sp. DHOC27]|uniref:glycosyltransferase family 4 protein n=1 Tax=Paraburkholderia sp. DHOC27 TaxID=2303330 RepID=UPI000E3D3AFE|nr:glycosyltransferase family 4 protein [Paraburkholderia sp. DHOC27]RFU47909.1 glycosyltransferase family 1 protein [Paraburkholderia sp. DHOC27]